MIEVQISPLKVERVLFVSRSDLEEDRDLQAWQQIREFIDGIDLKLRTCRDTGVKTDIR